VLLDTSSGTNAGISKVQVDWALNEAGSFSFTIVKSHPLYDSIEPLRTYVDVTEDGTEIFYGRVIMVKKSPLTGTKQVTCEGAFAFLLDSEMPVDSSEVSYTAANYFKHCLDVHNQKIENDAARKLLAGNITITDASVSKGYKNSSRTQVQSVMKNQLLNVYDGFFRVRKNGTAHYLDWVEQVGVTNPQTIRIAQNVSSISATESGEDIFTILCPKGNSTSSNSSGIEIDPIVISNEMVQKYGKIMRTVSFDANDVATLRTKANRYVEKLKNRLTLTDDIGFVDMKYLDGTSPMVHIGDVFTGIDGYSGTKLTASNVTRDLLNPANDKLSLKTDKDLMSTANSNGSNSGGGGSGGKGGGRSRSFSGSSSKLYKHIRETTDDLFLDAKNIEIRADEKISNIAGTVETQAETITNLSGRVTNQEGKWTTFEGTGIYQNREAINTMAGKFLVDEQGTLVLKSGTQFKVSGDGTSTNVGRLIYVEDGRVKDVGQIVSSYEGSYSYNHDNEIGGIVGRYTVRTYRDPDNPFIEVIPEPGANPKELGYYERITHGTISDDEYVLTDDTTVVSGKKYYLPNDVEEVIFDSGGGYKLMQDGVEYGLYTNRDGTTELTGGIVVNKINDNGDTETKILGKHIVVGNGQTSQTLEQFRNDAANQEGVFAQYKTDVPTIHTGSEQPTDAKEGELWLKDAPARTWEDAEDALTWVDDPEYNWNELGGSILYEYTYARVAQPKGNPKQKGYYEKDGDGKYILTKDTSVVSGKSYYALDWVEKINEATLAQDAYVSDTSAGLHRIYAQVTKNGEEAHAYRSEWQQTASMLWNDMEDRAQELGSRIEQSTTEIRTEVHAAKSSLYSEIKQTATNIAHHVADEKRSIYSHIEQTASSINSSVADLERGMYSNIRQTASEIRAHVKDVKEGLESTLTQTASEIRSEVKDTKNGLESEISQTAGEIRARVTSVDENNQKLEGRLDIQDSEVSLLVGNKDGRPKRVYASRSDFPETGSTSYLYYDKSTKKYYEWKNGQYVQTDPEAYINAAGIVARINEDKTTDTQILGTRIIIGELDDKDLNSWAKDAKDGSGVFTKFLTVGTLTASILKSKIATITTLEAKNIEIYNEDNGGHLSCGPIDCGAIDCTSIETNAGAISCGDIDADNVSTNGQQLRLIDAKIENNILKITRLKDDGKTETLSFSKATSLSGAWSSSDLGKLTVTASPQGTTYTAQIYVEANGNPTRAALGKALLMPVKISAYMNGSETPSSTRYTSDVLVNATLLYNEGWAAAYGKVTLPSAGSNSTMVVKTPPSSVDGNATNTIYTLRATKNDAYISTYSGESATNYAHITHNQYNNGWAAAYAKVTLPTAGSSSTMVVKTPPSTVDGNATSTTYTLRSTQNDAYISIYNGNNVTNYAHIAHNQYQEGRAAGIIAGWDAACEKISRLTNTIRGPKPTSENNGAIGGVKNYYTAAANYSLNQGSAWGKAKAQYRIVTPGGAGSWIGEKDYDVIGEYEISSNVTLEYRATNGYWGWNTEPSASAWITWS